MAVIYQIFAVYVSEFVNSCTCTIRCEDILRGCKSGNWCLELCEKEKTIVCLLQQILKAGAVDKLCGSSDSGALFCEAQQGEGLCQWGMSDCLPAPRLTAAESRHLIRSSQRFAVSCIFILPLVHYTSANRVVSSARLRRVEALQWLYAPYTVRK